MHTQWKQRTSVWPKRLTNLKLTHEITDFCAHLTNTLTNTKRHIMVLRPCSGSNKERPHHEHTLKLAWEITTEETQPVSVFHNTVSEQTKQETDVTRWPREIVMVTSTWKKNVVPPLKRLGNGRSLRSNIEVKTGTKKSDMCVADIVCYFTLYPTQPVEVHRHKTPP